jgi:quinol monooxygenase YgiN
MAQQITRIVKMTFRKDCVSDFLTLFQTHRDRIAATPGCLSLELLQDTTCENIFFTRSLWEDPAYLEAYRQSPLFGVVWPQTKSWFEKAAEAWTLAGRWP